MKKNKLLVGLVVLSLSIFMLAGCGGGDAVDEETTSSEEIYSQDFTIVNQTGVEIFGVYLSPSSAEEWGDNILTTDSLADGQATDVTFDGDANEQYWDLLVEDSEGEALQWSEIDLFTISELTLKFDNGEPTATYK